MIATRPGAATPTRYYPSTTATFNGDLDYIAIEHAMNGETVQLTRGERIEAARQLDTRGIHPTEIGRRLGVSRETVVTWRKTGWAIPAAVPDPEPIDIGGATHGRSGYSKGCRCRPCKDGANAASKAAKARRRTAA
ncbi:helix-turn-helix domain-containing protein [Streptomyces sp. NPDC058869]|uniref:helix-turn-helix domain-containing protein n=1 Tax=Streptomyces sp. NPDC058869 TaxID=3346659 RepID=UPI00368D8135